MATLLRAVIINPLHRRLPRIVVMIVGTCNRFTCQDYLLPQWRDIWALYDKHLSKVLGPRTSPASDGDTRRRLAFLQGSLTVPPPTQYTLTAQGFTHHGTKTMDLNGSVQGATMTLDQDYFHNGKKMINSWANASRTLKMGPDKTAAMQHVVQLLNAVPRQQHGINKTDTDRQGSKAMDWPSCQRLFTLHALATMKTQRDLPGQAGQSFLAGDIRFLSLTRDYISMFMDQRMPHRTRVKIAARVATYLRLWHVWVLHTPGITKETDFITREAFQDVVLSCHFVVLLIKIFRDFHPNVGIPFDLTGTDVCEDYFSSLGSWNMNKRTYTIREALQTTRSQIRLKVLESVGNVKIPKRKTRQKANWDGEEHKDHPTDTTIYPTEVEMQDDWAQGVAQAYQMAEEDRMQPAQQGRGRARAFPDWWLRPHELDPTFKQSAGMNEEQLIDDNADDCPHSSEEDTDNSHSSDADDEGALGDLVGSASHAAEGHEQGLRSKISQTIKVPYPPGVWHKAKVMAQINDGNLKLSADRGKRVLEQPHVNRRPFNARTDEWLICLGTDVAVNFGNNIWLGRIERMRKRNKRWTDYSLPVELGEDRTCLGDLRVQCRWYKRVLGGGAHKEV